MDGDALRGHGKNNHYDWAKDTIYFDRTSCECERPIVEGHGSSMHCVTCGLPISPDRAARHAGACRHCAYK